MESIEVRRNTKLAIMVVTSSSYQYKSIHVHKQTGASIECCHIPGCLRNVLLFTSGALHAGNTTPWKSLVLEGAFSISMAIILFLMCEQCNDDARDCSLNNCCYHFTNNFVINSLPCSQSVERLFNILVNPSYRYHNCHHRFSQV